MECVVEVLCSDDPGAEWLNNEGLPIVHALGPAYSSYGYVSGLVSWLAINAPRFDVVTVHGLWQYVGFAVWLTLARTNTPYYVYTHGMLDPWFKHSYPLKHQKNCLYWPWAEFRILRDARRVIFTCEEEMILAVSPSGCTKREML